MSRPRSCEQCWANHRETPATYNIDGSDLCTPCLLEGGYEIAKAVRLGTPFAMAVAAGAGAGGKNPEPVKNFAPGEEFRSVVTVHAKDPQEFLANGGAALVNAALKYAIANPPQARDEDLVQRAIALQSSPAKSTKGLAETRRGSGRPSSPSTTQEKKMRHLFTGKCGAEGCIVQITSANKSGYCQKHFYISKKVDPKAKPVAGVCSKGCGRKLRADNRSGICTPCTKGKPLPDGSDLPLKLQRKAATRAAKPSTTVKHKDQFNQIPEVEKSANGAATLIFTEAQMDRMFASLDLDGKVACLQGYLNSNEQA
jgi:hypothetical protein